MIRRLAAAVFTLGVAAVLLVAAWPQLFALQRTPLVAHAASLRGLASCVMIGLLLLVVVTSTLNRGFRSMAASLGVMLIAFVLVNAAVLSTRGFGGDSLGTQRAPEGASEVTVLAWNTLGPATSAEDVAALALEAEADIVVLPETILETATQVAVLMREGGSPMWARTLSYDQVSPALSTSLLTSAELGEYDYDSLAETTAVLPTVVATSRDGSGPTIVAVHAVAPMLNQFENWKRDLNLLAGFCSGENVIMAGDFNATIDHMTGLGAEPGKTLGECTDAAMAAGSAAIGTWPTRLPALLGAPIDHVMATSDWTVLGTEVIQSLDDNGSDHRPIVARLAKSG
ncbi:MAG TPA: endonuclease/exonuclease/phosphatase family protein [Homoserinimonas sp.]|nr:endonuclease/exonuclease/phosphatase family protein [Homoserinimonas sp.]